MFLQCVERHRERRHMFTVRVAWGRRHTAQPQGRYIWQKGVCASRAHSAVPKRVKCTRKENKAVCGAKVSRVKRRAHAHHQAAEKYTVRVCTQMVMRQQQRAGEERERAGLKLVIEEGWEGQAGERRQQQGNGGGIGVGGQGRGR